MEKVFLGLVASNPDPRLVVAVRALMDFVYLASLQSHTSHTLLALRQALDTFHLNKQVFIELGGRDSTHFNIPKLHSLDHYEELIRLFGSADGFNTESPERLHIDFAKNAYRASNRKNYIEQMAEWLSRQEAVEYFAAFIEWTKEVSQPKKPDDTVELTADDLVISTRHAIAKQPPPASRHVLASDIISADGHGASRFLPALTTFLSQQGSTLQPRDFDVFGLWKQLVYKLPHIPEVGERHSKNPVRASAARAVLPPTSGDTRRMAAQPAFLDFAFIKTAEVNSFTDGTSLHGLRVAQVRAIFQLPRHYGIKSEHPLAYIEWFTPLRKPDDITGYYHVSRSSRRKGGIDGPYAEIITVDRIARNVMLMPKTRGNDKQYFLNSHIDGHMFCMIKLGYQDCLPV